MHCSYSETLSKEKCTQLGIYYRYVCRPISYTLAARSSAISIQNSSVFFVVDSLHWGMQVSTKETKGRLLYKSFKPHSCFVDIRMYSMYVYPLDALELASESFFTLIGRCLYLNANRERLRVQESSQRKRKRERMIKKIATISSSKLFQRCRWDKQLGRSGGWSHRVKSFPRAF